MKIRYIIIVLAFLSLVSCRVDLIDVDTSAASAAAESEMIVDVRVSEVVENFDLFVFRSTSVGVLLEYTSLGIAPNIDEEVTGTKDRLVWSSKITLPSTGAKKVVVVGNSSRVSYPDMTVGVTTIEDFCSELSFSIAGGKLPQAPFVMTGQTTVANSSDAHIFVKLGRQSNRLNIVNKASDRLSISSVKIANVPGKAYPFVNDFDVKVPDFISYPATDLSTPVYILYTKSDSPEYCPQIVLSGKKDGVDFTETIQCEQPMYADYNTTLSLSLSADGKIATKYSPDFSSFQTDGAALTYYLASWMWTGLYANNDYAQAWLAGNPIVSPEGASMVVVDVKNDAYSPSVSYSTGTSGQLKNRLRAHSMYTGDYFLWTVPVAEAKKGGTLNMINGMVSATQWGPKYFMMEYSFNGTEWTPVTTPLSEKTASGANRNVTYTIKLLKNDDPQPLDFSIPVNASIKNGILYARLTVADACCSKELNGDIEESKTAGITYIHVKNYDSADKDRTFDESWSSIAFTYKEPEK